MKENLDFNNKCLLFAGILERDLEALLSCLSARKKRYGKGDFIFSEGERPARVGLVLSGAVHILKEDVWGNQNVLTKIGEGDLFGEAVVCSGAEEFPVSAVAAKDTQALFLDYRRIITSCSSACAFHSRLIENMLGILAGKNMGLLSKMEHITKRTTREKLLSYLSEQSKQRGENAFDIPFNRQELADYLSVERSALSAELSKMQADGLVEFRKNHFKLLEGMDQ